LSVLTAVEPSAPGDRQRVDEGRCLFCGVASHSARAATALSHAEILTSSRYSRNSFYRVTLVFASACTGGKDDVSNAGGAFHRPIDGYWVRKRTSA
jgi:hypothetical protein